MNHKPGSRQTQEHGSDSPDRKNPAAEQSAYPGREEETTRMRAGRSYVAQIGAQECDVGAMNEPLSTETHWKKKLIDLNDTIKVSNTETFLSGFIWKSQLKR